MHGVQTKNSVYSKSLCFLLEEPTLPAISHVFTFVQWKGSMEAITGRSHLAPGGKKSKPAVLLNMI